MGFLEDVRLGLRSLRRQPLCSFAACSVLALSIAANASVFSLVNSILLEPLKMKHPEQLVVLDQMRSGGARYPFTIRLFLELRRRNAVMVDMAASGGMNANLTSEAEPERVLGVRASGNLFQMLGVNAAIGRVLEPEDDSPQRPKVVVLTDGLWRRLFAASPDAIGKQIRLNGLAYTVVGVLPPSYRFRLPNQEFAIALATDADPWRAEWKSTAFLSIIGRRKPEFTVEQSKAGLNDTARLIRTEHPNELAMFAGVDVTPLADFVTSGSRTMLLALIAAVGAVLLIACANLSSLAMARSVSRRKELAIRWALGATRWSVARMLLGENVLLFLVGGTAGVLLAQWGVQVLLFLTPSQLPRQNEVHLDWVVVAASLATAVLCGILFGAIPAFRALASDQRDSLRSGGRGNSAGPTRATLRAALVVVQTALSLLLLGATGLLLKSFDQLLTVHPGFQTEQLTTFRLSLPSTRYSNAASVSRFHDNLRDRIAALPGVQLAGATSILPLSGPIASAVFTIMGRPALSEKDKPSAQYRMADSAYFQTMGIRVRSGRPFVESDTASSRPVAVISQTASSKYWQGVNPIGSVLKMEDNTREPRELEVVGVVGDTRESSLEEDPRPIVYIAMTQVPADLVRFLTNSSFWVVRVQGQVNVTQGVRDAIRQVDADVAVRSGTMEQYIFDATASRRFTVRILSCFAAAAMLLAAGGLYALIAFTTAQRMREFGVMLALGAGKHQIAKLVLAQGLRIAIAGGLAGIAAAYVLGGLTASLLYQVSPHDPVVLAGASLLLLIISMIACYVPARRAMQADPMECLRSE